MKNKEVVIPKSMEGFYTNYHFAPAVRDDDRLFCAGQLGNTADHTVDADPEIQFTQAFENVKTVLAEAGVSFDNVVEMTTFHVGLQQNLSAFMKVKDRYMQEPYPAWTAIGITELGFPGALVEIKVIARLNS